jgi:hypothetical protein
MSTDLNRRSHFDATTHCFMFSTIYEKQTKFLVLGTMPAVVPIVSFVAYLSGAARILFFCSSLLYSFLFIILKIIIISQHR